MDIGQPQREIRVEPLENPISTPRPAREPQPERQRPVKTPEREKETVGV